MFFSNLVANMFHCVYLETYLFLDLCIYLTPVERYS